MNSSTGLLRRPAPAREGAVRFLRGPAPAASAWLAANWQRLALPTLLLVTAVAYLWDLSASGNANSFYAAAVQAGTKSWKAFFFGSLDSSNYITVDKPPASLWVMALSGRIFGFSSWSMLAPQALEGVAAVALLYAVDQAVVRRGRGAGGRRAVGRDAGGGAHVPLQQPRRAAGAPAGGRRLLPHPRAGARRHALGGGGGDDDRLRLPGQDDAGVPRPAGVRAGLPGGGAHRPAPARCCRCWPAVWRSWSAPGWWVAIVALWPAGSRPMIDGSSDNSILNLITGYNGLGRIFGSGGPGGGGGGGARGTSAAPRASCASSTR